MPIPDSGYSTLANINIKIRRLTRSVSENQLSDDDINNYVNTFVLYDFPEHLRLFNLRTTFTFYTQPYVDTYSTLTADADVNSPLYNFTNKYISVHDPVYIAGYQSMYSQSRQQFYSIYPFLNNIQSIGYVGNGIQTNFAGTLPNIPVLQNNVLFTSVDTNNLGLAIIDQPIAANPTTGNLVLANNPTLPGVGMINYVTGMYNFTFPTAPAVDASIDSQTVPYVASLPQALLFFDGEFVVRPVPDQPYSIQFEVYQRPTQLLMGTDMPQLSEWWQYIAYGAARKVLQDRMDLDTLAMIEPEYQKQEQLVLRRTIVQQASQRTSTIFTEQVSSMYGYGWWYGGGQF
jgi:hypothetical protein